LLPKLDAFLAAGGRKVGLWHDSLNVAEVDFDDEADAFDNINTPEQLAGSRQAALPSGHS
jgi:molybdopterin-guanine dinucleotide biosynthesis protein A